MSIVVGWEEIVVRLAFTILAGALIGLDRGEHGRPAGLRTTILVCLAASASMIQANLLLDVAGKAHDSFVVLDLMRLPLGILSGMGFIGGGVILRRGNLVTGVTTAATLWFVTVMGLCFGGGQLILGLAMLAIGWFVLAVLRHLENRLYRDRHATLSLVTTSDGPREETVRAALRAARFSILRLALTQAPASGIYKLRCDVLWRASPDDLSTPDVVQRLASLPGVKRVGWQS
ncbi:MAG: MgtC/SapB family protein [Singulisphaera sp.]